jgi:hypothetical protein
MLTNDTQTVAPPKSRDRSLLVLLAVLFGALSVVCYQAYLPHDIMWANDTQLGPLKSSSAKALDSYTGHWMDHWWIGIGIPNNSPSFSNMLATVVSPETFLKIFTPLTMLLLGFSAWLLFRQLKFAPMVCVLGGVAAGLNMHCFSIASWGLGTWNVSIAMIFLALAILVTESIRQIWIKAILAGLVVGLSVMDGFDLGAILSIYFGVFILFYCWITESGMAKRMAKTFEVGALVVLFALLIAASTISTLVGTQIVGISGTGQSAQEKKEHWDFATQWSFPKLESLRLFMPGVFGYRLDEFMTIQDKSAAYWGKVGEFPPIARLESSDPEVRVETITSMVGTNNTQVIEAMRGDNKEIHQQILDSIKHQVQLRHSGNGEYAGVVVALFAVFALLNSARPASSPYTRNERLMVWFWGLAALFSLVAAWGRFSFVYAQLYKLPYFSTIRNPIKFLHAFHITWLILAAFGLEAFYRCYLRQPAKPPSGQLIPPTNWWQKLSGFDKGYAIGLLLTVGGAFVGWLLFAGSKKDLVEYLTHNGFNDDLPARLASGIAAFSVHEAAWFVFLLALSAGVVISGLAGAWTGRRMCLGWAFLCAIMVFDLGRTDLPWVRYFNYDQKYSMNEITKVLENKPYEYRVVGRLAPQGGYDLPADGNFAAVIHWWLENDFPYHDIQSLEIDQMPRQPYLEGNYLGALTRPPNTPPDFALSARLWKLTSTRYILAASSQLANLNLADPAHQPFHYLKRFNLGYKPGITYPQDAGDMIPEITDQGTCALIEYTGALPRAKLYANWLMPPGDQYTLGKLTDPRWDPDQSVLVSLSTNQPPLPPPGTNASANPGAVSITDYQSKDIKLQASAKTPSVLLYNDRFDDSWHVWVDGKPAPLLRCNYIMRGVFLSPGEHTVEFRFQRSLAALYVTLAAMAVGVLLGVCLICSHFTGKPFGKTVPP